MIDFFTKDFRIGDGSVAVVLYSIEKRWIVMFVTNVVLVKILLYLIRSPARDILGGYCSSRRKQSVNVFAYLFSMCYRLSDLPRPKTNVLANRSKTSSSAFIVGSRKLEKRTARNRKNIFYMQTLRMGERSGFPFLERASPIMDRRLFNIESR